MNNRELSYIKNILNLKEVLEILLKMKQRKRLLKNSVITLRIKTVKVYYIMSLESLRRYIIPCTSGILTEI
nr:MAG TPA: hypothetical protein [Caudoviricetes sp.]DAI58451.1 MAG TPA: hypothetical protein [Crassvirales sp.]